MLITIRRKFKHFILMYNTTTTPHGTTGTSPSDKIPSIKDVVLDETDSATRDMDIINKQKGKEREDKSRNAKHVDIQIGDTVLLRNAILQNKLTPTFGSTEYRVTNRVGNEITIQGHGKTFRRHVNHVKNVFTDDLPSSEEPENSSALLPRQGTFKIFFPKPTDSTRWSTR